MAQTSGSQETNHGDDPLAPHGKDRSPNLLAIVNRGAAIRRHRLIEDLRSLLPAMTIAVLGQCAVYLTVMIRAGREDWGNIITTCLALAIVPFMVGLLLTALRQHKFPITLAAAVTLVVFNFAVAGLAAFRTPVSYLGLLATAPVAIVCLVYANVRFHRALRDRVGLLDFAGAEEVKARLGSDVSILHKDTDDVIGYERILIDSEAHHSSEWAQFLTRAYMLGIEVTPWMSYYETRWGRVDVDSFDLTHLAFSPSQIYYSKVKRFIDIVAALVLLPVFLPLMAAIWLYIRIIDGGPSIFRQERRGYGGRTFSIYKFRTMRKGLSAGATQVDDFRILPGCKYLRQFRLDELPQIFNILRGDMSWIGPRPVTTEIAEGLEAVHPQYLNRQLVLPGLTGWAQVSHGYADNSEQEIEKLSFDLYYVKNLSFDLDLLILFKTVRTLLLKVGGR
jgi:lipopolysaccharide/colanic/teichoic acid biosynthesis glycosyltransferase